MPHTHSAKKELRKNIKRRARNDAKKTLIKSIKKEIKNFVLNKQTEKAKELLPKFYKAVDKAAKTNTIHRNKAARLKSRLSKFIIKNG